jgi:hypothetical protein
MVILVDDEKSSAPVRRFRNAPPVVDNIRRAKQRNGSPHRFSNGIDSSDDEFDMRAHSRTSDRTNGMSRNTASDGLRVLRPGSSTSVNLHLDEQRATHGTSINSFALG